MKEYTCQNCGNTFVGNPPAKFCYECRPKMKRKRDTLSLRARRAAKKAEKKAEVQPLPKMSLDEKIALYRSKGVTYAQQQIQDTLRMIRSENRSY